MMQMKDPIYPFANTTQDAVVRVLGSALIDSELAQMRDEAGILPHINTENTARDMMTIVNAHGQEKIQYWGFSFVWSEILFVCN
jgi:hypothetical protein